MHEVSERLQSVGWLGAELLETRNILPSSFSMIIQVKVTSLIVVDFLALSDSFLLPESNCLLAPLYFQFVLPF